MISKEDSFLITKGLSDVLRRGTAYKAKQLAYKVHTDLGDKFVRGIDCRTKRTVGADHELAAHDVLKIAANA